MKDEPIPDEKLDRLVGGNYRALGGLSVYRLIDRLARELQATRTRQVEREQEVVRDIAAALAVPVSSPDGHEDRRLTYAEAIEWVASRSRAWSALLRRMEVADPRWLAQWRGRRWREGSGAPSPGQRRWRIGQSYGIHVYEESDATPEGDRPVATFFWPVDAERAVNAVNLRLPGDDLDLNPPLEHQVVPAVLDSRVPYLPQIGDPAQTTLTGVITAIDPENGYIWLQGSAAGGHVPWTFKLHWGAEFARPGEVTIYDEMRAERQRAHTKHGATSMESASVKEMYRAVILGEEVGEVSEIVWAALWALALSAAGGRVATVMTDGRHASQLDLVELRKELVQVATMAAAWADRIPRTGTTEVTE